MRYLIYFFIFTISIITAIVLKDFIYNRFYFLIFTIVVNFYLIISFSKKLACFHIFMSIFLWLGFWFKFITAYFFTDLFFFDSQHITDISHINKVLKVSTFGIFGFLCSALLNFKITSNFNSKDIENKLKNFNYFLKNYKNTILSTFIILVFFVAFLNLKFSLYQKGVISDVNLGLLTSATLRWLLIFGFTSISSILIYHSLLKKRLVLHIFFISLIENFVSSISMLSRGMFVNSMALFVGIYRYSQNNLILKFNRSFFISILIFVILFFISISIVQDLRNQKYYGFFSTTQEPEYRSLIKNESINKVYNHGIEFIYLLKRRFVGIEAVSEVVNYKKLNFKLFFQALEEKKSDNRKTFYSSKIRCKDNCENDEEINLFQPQNNKIFYIKVPGIIAFLYYSGSLLFLFISSFILGSFCMFTEKIISKILYQNVIFASLISQVLAYRLLNFGYVPSNSYLILMAIIINIVIIYIIYFASIRLKTYLKK